MAHIRRARRLGKGSEAHADEFAGNGGAAGFTFIASAEEEVRAFCSPLQSDTIESMDRSEMLTPALKKAQDEGIDLTMLYERLSWTPTERLEKHLQMLEFANELRKAGQKKRGDAQSGRPPKGTS